MTLEHIEVKKLSKSALNVRKTTNKAACEELKASILAHGLMQNLVVIPAKKGKYHVIAGARRLEALQSLIAEGKLPENTFVDCRMATEAEAQEMSLAENSVRLAMHPADQFEAFAALVDHGQTAAKIAKRFGVKETLVLKRLKLGKVAPELLAEYRAEQIELDVLEAFTVTDDRKKQVDLYRGLKSWEKRNPHHIRDSLTKGSISSTDKIAKFVGLEAYEAAGGRSRADLFGKDVYLEDSALLNRLAGEKLEAEAEKLRAEGWGWVEVNFDEDTAVTRRCDRIEAIPLDAPAELVAEKKAIEAEIEAIDAEWGEDDEDDDDLLDAIRKRSEDAEDRLEAIEEKLESYVDFDPEQKKLAGCFVSIIFGGKLDIEMGLVKPEDKKAVAKAQPEGAEPQDTPDDKPGLPQSLIEDLKAYRTQVAQVAIAENPSLAFDLLVMTAARYAIGSRPHFDGPDVHFRQSHPTPSGGEQTPAADRLAVLKSDLPLSWMREKTEAAQLDAFQALAEADKLRILAYCTAMTLQPKLTPGAGKQQTAYDAALALSGMSVAGYWRPSAANFLSRLKTAQLLDIGREIFGEQWAHHRTNAKKAVLVSQLAEAFADPLTHGKTPEERERLASWLPEGMAFVTAKAEAEQAEAA